MNKRPKRTILVVEDVAEISSQMNAMLRAKGHDVLFAADAEEAFKIAETRRPTLVLTDLDLPTLGLLVRLIREHPDLKETPVAIMDINELKVMANMDELEKLIQSTE
jgi:CheY-like chemotaxis protein